MAEGTGDRRVSEEGNADYAAAQDAPGYYLEGNWTNCKEIFYEARKRDPKLGMATVYRTVSALEEIGVLVRSYQYSFVPDREDEAEAVSWEAK